MYRRLALILVLIAAAAAALYAQQGRRPGEAEPLPYVPNVPCPHPVARTLTAPPPSPPVRSATDFSGTLGTATANSAWNQTNPNQGFGHTFDIPAAGNECCIWAKATLIVKVKALQAGAAGTNGASVNDWVQLVKNGSWVVGSGQQPFAGGATVGQTATVTIAVPPSVLSSGVVSFYVQDDTAVQSAELRLEGCCLK